MTVTTIRLTCVPLLLLVLLGCAFAATPTELVYAAYDSGDPDRAIELCSQAIKQDPSFKYAYCARALARQEKGDLAGAEADLTKAIEISPLFVDAYVWRAEVRKLRNDTEGSKADLLKAEEVRAQGDHVIKDLDAAVERDPTNAKKVLDRAYYKKQKGDYDGAIADFDKYLQLVGRPSNHLVLFHRANAKKAKGDIDGALQDYTVAIKMFPGNAEAYVKRGELRKAHGLEDDGEADLKRAEEIRAERKARKVRQLEEKLAAAPHDAGLLFQSARARMDAGDNAGALSDVNRILDDNDGNAMAYALRAEIRKRMGDKEGSAADRRKMRELLKPRDN